MLSHLELRLFVLWTWIGKHLRHARDHFQLLLNVASSPPPRVLSYDIRIRNTPMEGSRSAAKESILDTIKQLEELVPRVNMDDPMTLQAVTPFLQEFQTTFGREVSAHNSCYPILQLFYQLWFAALHCVHHWSTVSLRLCRPKEGKLMYQPQVRVIAGEMVGWIC